MTYMPISEFGFSISLFNLVLWLDLLLDLFQFLDWFHLFVFLVVRDHLSIRVGLSDIDHVNDFDERVHSAERVLFITSCSFIKALLWCKVFEGGGVHLLFHNSWCRLGLSWVAFRTRITFGRRVQLEILLPLRSKEPGCESASNCMSQALSNFCFDLLVMASKLLPDFSNQLKFCSLSHRINEVRYSDYSLLRSTIE